MPSRLRVAAPEHYALRADSVVGGEVYERELLRRLPAHGIDVDVGPPRARAPHWSAAPLVWLPWLLPRVRREPRPQLLRAGSVRVTGPSTLIAGRAARVPVVIHQHHLEPRWRELEAAILRRADAVVTVSERSRAELAALGVAPARVHVVPDGLDPPAGFAPADDAWPADDLRLLHVGRLEPRKRAGIAVHALALLVRDGVPASLVLAGDGPQAGELRRLAAQLGVGDRVRFEGRVGEARKWALYDGADVLLFPSALEGFGIVAAEAHARGLPVVAAAGTGTEEVVDDGRSGLLVASTAEAFAGAVRRLADPAARAPLADEARRIGARFSWDACAAAVAEVYRAVASSTGSTSR